MRRYGVLSLTAGLITALLLAVGGQASAAAPTDQQRESITLSPANQRYELKPGDVKRDKLTIINDGETTYDFILYAQPYSINKNNDYTNPNFQATPSNADVHKWVRFEQSEYRLEPGESVEVNYILTVPDNAAGGGHYGVLFAETQPSPDPAGASVARKKRVGSIIYATVDGDVRYGGESLGITSQFWQKQPPLMATSTVKNTGNTDFLTTVDLTVKDLFGNVKYNESKQYVVLPDTSRTISMQWAQSPWFGLFKVEATTSFLDKQQDSYKGYVLLAPMWLIVVVVLGVIAAAGYALWRHRR